VRRRTVISSLAAVLVLGACAEESSSTSETTPPDGTPIITVVGEDERLRELAAQCEQGDPQACDDLWNASDVGSEFERIGAICGGRNPDGDPSSFGNCVAHAAETTAPPGATTVESTSPPTTIPLVSVVPPSELMDRWVVIVASLAVENDGTEQAAQREVDRLRQEGYDAGVFRTDEFASLNPGFWVVFIEVFDDPDEASAACGGLIEGGVVDDCYHRQVSDSTG